MSSQYMTPAGELSCHKGKHETIKKDVKKQLRVDSPAMRQLKID